MIDRVFSLERERKSREGRKEREREGEGGEGKKEICVCVYMYFFLSLLVLVGPHRGPYPFCTHLVHGLRYLVWYPRFRLGLRSEDEVDTVSGTACQTRVSVLTDLQDRS